MVNTEFPAGRENVYQTQYDEYWSADDRIGESSSDLEQVADQIVMSCGVGRTLDIGSGEGALVTALLRRGVDAHGLDVSEVVVSRCNQRIPNRFTQGSVLALPFEDGTFQTVVSTDCMEHLAPEDVLMALKEIHRVAGRYVFLKLATTLDRDGHWHLTVEGRAWWETKCLEAGFRKHPAYYKINPYESLNQDGWQIIIPLEKVPTAALLRYPLVALKEERDLHMDMLREHGSRSDAHVSRYHFACKYVRPGDSVIDAACGLGYGSHVINSLTKCSTVTGIDGSAYGVDYANANFDSNGTMRFVQGYLPECLQAIPDNSIDCVISFETLEQVENPTALLVEFHRILTPGGRLISSVPHDWSDETGQDPNPFHLHVYTRPKFISDLTQCFEIEHLLGQTADRVKKPETCEWEPRSRSFCNIDLQDATVHVEAEWLIAVACKSPLNGENVPYIENVFTPDEQTAAGNALAFARDYQNPWLIRSLVSMGLRTENNILRERWASSILGTAPSTSADYGAALCILAYAELTDSTVSQKIELLKLIDQYIASEPVANPNVLRWKVSLRYVQGLIALTQGQRDHAKQCFSSVIAYPVVQYSPTLLTKSAEAAYILGLLFAADNELKRAEAVWSTSLASISKDIGLHLHSPKSGVMPEFELREITSVLSTLGRLVMAIGHAQKIVSQPTVFFDQVNDDLVTKLPWLTSQREAWERTATEREKAIVVLQTHVHDLLTGNAWLNSQREAWERTATEREQAIVALQTHLHDLVTGKAWLTSQREAWERTANEREQSVIALQAQVHDLLTGNAWLTSQREAWERTANEREQSITALQAQVHDLLTGNAWLTSQREAWERTATEREQANTALTYALQEANDRLAESDAILNKLRKHWAMRWINYFSRRNS